MKCLRILLLIVLLINCAALLWQAFVGVPPADEPEKRPAAPGKVRRVPLGSIHWGREKRHPVLTALAISPDGKQAVVGVVYNHHGSQQSAGLWWWDLTTLQQVPSPLPYDFEEGIHREFVSAVAFSPDGKQMLTGGGDGGIKLWDITRGRLLRSWPGHQKTVAALAWSANGQLALSGAEDGTFQLYDVSTGQLRHEFGRADNLLTHSIALSLEGRWALSCCDNGPIRVWDVATRRQLRELEGARNGNRCRHLQFSPDGRRALGVQWDHVLIWDVATGRMVRQLGPVGSGPVHSAVFTPTGRHVLCGGGKGLELWEVDSARVALTFEGENCGVDHIAFTPDGKRALSASSLFILVVWDLTSGEEICTLLAPPSGEPPVTGVAFLPGARQLISASAYGVILWDVASGQPIRMMDDSKYGNVTLVLSADGQWVLAAGSGGGSGWVHLWEVSSGKLLWKAPGMRGHPYCLAISPDGRLALSTVEGNTFLDNPLCLREMASGKLVRTLRGHTSLVSAIAFSPDSKLALSSSQDKTVKLWDLTSGQPIKTFENPSWDWGQQIGFSADGNLVHLRGLDVTTLEVATGKRVQTPLFPREKQHYRAYSPDGKRCLSCEAYWEEWAISLWDVATAKPLRTFSPAKGVARAVQVAAFSADGKRVAVGGEGHMLRVWELDTGRLIQNLVLSREDRDRWDLWPKRDK
jgi:WD40 repeat protein